MNTVFSFKRFSVKQDSNVFKVGTDAVLLGALAGSNDRPNLILEIGTGTGIISLMLAQRFTSSEIIALDSDESAAELATENFKNSPFSNRITCKHTSFQEFNSKTPFDLLISNPPYFESGTQGKLSHARHTKLLPYQDLITGVSKHLSKRGVFSVILPIEVKEQFSAMAREVGLYPVQEVVVSNTPQSKPKRVVLHFTFAELTQMYGSLIIRDNQNTFSKAYIELTKDFHPFL